MKIIVSLLLSTLLACDSVGAPSVELGPYSACEVEVCDYVSVCQARHIGIWDWRTEQACLGSFRCGVTPEACQEAILALPCLDVVGDDVEVVTEENRLGWVDVRKVCQWNVH